MVTYADEKAYSYFLYSAMLLDIYAHIQGHNLLIFCSSYDVEKNKEEDARWEKVRVLRHLLQLPVTSDRSYLLWVDADLIFLDLSYSLLPLLEQYSRYDLLVSAEMHGGTGVANTGSMLLHHSAYSISFFDHWWVSNHSLGHDQILFNIVYQRLLPESRAHVKILPTRWLNSMPPAYIQQNPTDPVLHLMGERNDIRQAAFQYAVQYAMEYLCGGGGDAVQRPQLGLTRVKLQMIVSNISYHRTHQLMDRIKSSISSMHELLELMSEARELLLTLHKVLGHRVPSVVLGFNQAFILAQHEQLYTILQHRLVCSEVDAQLCIQGLYFLALLGNDLIAQLTATVPPPPAAAAAAAAALLDRIEELYGEVNGDMTTLLPLIAPASRSAVLESQAMLLLNRAQYLQEHLLSRAAGQASRQHLLDDIEQSYRQALHVLQVQIDEQARNEYHHITPLVNTAQLLCHALDDREEEGLEYYQQAIALLERLLLAEEQYKAEHEQYIQALDGVMQCIAKQQQQQQQEQQHMAQQYDVAGYQSKLLGVISVQEQSHLPQEKRSIYSAVDAAAMATAKKRRFRKKKA